MSDVEPLTGAELLALAALLRTSIKQDGAFSSEERAVLSRIALAVGLKDDAQPAGAYRDPDQPLVPLGEAGLYELIDVAGRELPNDEAINEAVRAVTRVEARQVIYGMVFELTSADGVQSSENRLLDWIVQEWSLRVEPL